MMSTIQSLKYLFKGLSIEGVKNPQKMALIHIAYFSYMEGVKNPQKTPICHIAYFSSMEGVKYPQKTPISHIAYFSCIRKEGVKYPQITPISHTLNLVKRLGSVGPPCATTAYGPLSNSGGGRPYLDLKKMNPSSTTSRTVSIR